MDRRTFIGAAVMTLFAGCTGAETENDKKETPNMDLEIDKQEIELGGWSNGELFRIADQKHDNQLYIIEQGEEISIAVA